MNFGSRCVKPTTRSSHVITHNRVKKYTWCVFYIHFFDKKYIIVKCEFDPYLKVKGKKKYDLINTKITVQQSWRNSQLCLNKRTWIWQIPSFSTSDKWRSESGPTKQNSVASVMHVINKDWLLSTPIQKWNGISSQKSNQK